VTKRFQSAGYPGVCRRARRSALALFVSGLAIAVAAPPAQADEIDKAQVKVFQDQIATLQIQLNALTQALARAQGATVAAATPASATVAVTTTAGSDTGARFIQRKSGKPATFLTHGGEITLYGVFDVAVEGATKGMGTLRLADGTQPVGSLGWQPDISTNMSYVGIRGTQAVGGHGLQFIYQLETQIDISAQSGSAETNSNQSNVVKGGLTSRNSYIGFASPQWGRVFIGKTDAPYKQSTARMNPFVGMFGDYAAIMGNTGGDNRVEFGTRLDHAIWYESPEFHGIRVNALFSPGQNRASQSDNIAAGESDCTGGNVPGSGGSLPIACNDGAFSDAISASLTFTHGPLYLVAAYERHGKVNRSSDLTGEYANPPQDYFNADTADEDAAKVGVQYALPTGTTVSGIFESLHRYVPAYLAFQNERQRTGYWLAATQQISPKGMLAIGWAHAGRTPGDPGQHNTSNLLPPLGSPGDGVGGTGADNIANMATVAYKFDLGGGLSAYINWAMVLNGRYAHFALGAGGRSVTIDCHDASDASGGLASDPHCWAGAKPQAVSTGVRYQF
jgi:predicted porin